MADNLAVTPGSGATVAADDIGGVLVQRVKLQIGADGAATDIAGDTTNGVLVDVSRVVPGTGATALGKAEDAGHTSGDTGVMALAVRQDSAAALAGTDADYQPLITDAQGRLWMRPAPVTVRISVTPTIDTAAYTSGDCLGGLMDFANAVRAAGGSGVIQSILVLDKTQAQRAAIDLLFFDRSVTVAGNNAAVAMSDADMANCLGVVSIGPYNTAWPGTPLNSLSTLTNVGLPIVCNGTSLYCQAIVRATPTYVASSDITVILTILQD